MVKLEILLGDEVYRERFVSYLMNHYGDRILPRICSTKEEAGEGDALVTDLLMPEALSAPKDLQGGACRYQSRGTHFYLRDPYLPGESEGKGETEGVVYMDKYQDVNGIVENILRQVGREVRGICGSGNLPGEPLLYGVYGLGANEYQLPYAMTLASVLAESRRVLLLDLQENSGLQELAQGNREAGLEELLVMSQSGRYSRSRMLSCIGHLENVDYVNPAKNTENICEVAEGTVLTMLGLLTRETDYEVLVINFGSRFSGFFNTMQKCRKIFLLQGQILRGSWREREFREELKERKATVLEENLIPTDIPAVTASSCSRLIEQWKWNEVGEGIRHFAAGAARG